MAIYAFLKKWITKFNKPNLSLSWGTFTMEFESFFAVVFHH